MSTVSTIFSQPNDKRKITVWLERLHFCMGMKLMHKRRCCPTCACAKYNCVIICLHANYCSYMHSICDHIANQKKQYMQTSVRNFHQSCVARPLYFFSSTVLISCHIVKLYVTTIMTSLWVTCQNHLQNFRWRVYILFFRSHIFSAKFFYEIQIFNWSCKFH